MTLSNSQWLCMLSSLFSIASSREFVESLGTFFAFVYLCSPLTVSLGTKMYHGDKLRVFRLIEYCRRVADGAIRNEDLAVDDL